MGKKLSDLSSGDKFQWNGYTWTVVAHTNRGTLVFGDNPLTVEEMERLEERLEALQSE